MLKEAEDEVSDQQEQLPEEEGESPPSPPPNSFRGIEEMWFVMPSELQRKILDPISLKSIFWLRNVDRFFNTVMFPNEAYQSFGSAATLPAPAFYFQSTCFPLSVEWFTFDFRSSLWQKMKRFETTTELEDGIFRRHLHCLAKEGLMNQCVFSAAGLLCILHESMREVVEDHSTVTYAPTLFPFIVWNPLTSKWRALPPCKHSVRRNYSVSDSSFIHAFRDGRGGYKILCTLKDYTATGAEMPLTTEVYDSKTGAWKECAPYEGERMRSSFGSGQGVFCSGVVYFQLWRPRSWILFCFDVAREEWSEEDSEQRSLKLFEWNGALMTALLPLDSWNKYKSAYVYRRERRKWVEVGIAVPAEVRKEFSRGEEIVASDLFMCLSGYDRHGAFKTAVYDKEDNLWRLAPPPPSCSKNCLPPCELRFVFRYTPSFTMEP